MNITVFLGAPGSGKGTQAKRLADGKRGFSHFSTGDMLRAAIKEGKPVGAKAKSFMDKGNLVPDELMIELIEDTLKGLPSSSKVLLDGFPRTVPQAGALDGNAATRVSKALYFLMPEPELIQRLTGRRICKNCGESFHMSFLPPKAPGKCDRCQGDLIQRDDDKEEVVQKRLSVFRSQNSQLLEYYEKSGKLLQIDANQPVESVQRRLTELLQ